MIVKVKSGKDKERDRRRNSKGERGLTVLMKLLVVYKFEL